MLIKELRTKHGFTQKEFGTKIGVSDRTIREWEKGKSIPSPNHLIQIGLMFDHSPDDLLRHYAEKMLGAFALERKATNTLYLSEEEYQLLNKILSREDITKTKEEAVMRRMIVQKLFACENAG